MTLEQSTVAAISVIDRTLRSLGVHDDLGYGVPQTRFSPTSPPPIEERRSRQTSSAQTPVITRIAAASQSCILKCSASVQHSPNRRTAACQTDEMEEDSVVAEGLRGAVELLSLTMKQTDLFEQTASQLNAMLIEKIDSTESKLYQLLAYGAKYRNSYEQKCVEHDEVTERMSLITLEEAAFEVVRSQFHSLFRSIENSVYEQPAKDGMTMHIGGKALLSPSEKEALLEKSLHSSLYDLTELLGECRRALEQ
jgi:hypothetical protein